MSIATATSFAVSKATVAADVESVAAEPLAYFNTDAVHVRTAEDIATGPGVEDPAVEEANEARIEKLVSLAESTLNPKDMLKKYAALGKAFVGHARWQKSKFKGWDKQDYDRAALRIEDQVKMRLPIKEVRMDVYARVYAFLEYARPIAPDVDKLSYYQVANKFLPMLQWDKVDIEGSIKKEWVVFLAEIVGYQTGNDPLTMKQLDAAIDERKDQIRTESVSHKDPEKAAEQERKAENAKLVAKRQASVGKVGKAVSDALTEGAISGKDIAETVASVAKAFNIEINTASGLDPATASVEDVRLFMAALFHHGKADQIRVIAEIATKMTATLDAVK